MSAEVVYVTSFRQLELHERIRGAFQLLPFIDITNDSDVKTRLLTNELAQFAGSIELAHLRAAPNIVFGELRTSEMGGLPPDRFLLMLLLWIGGLFDNAWLWSCPSFVDTWVKLPAVAASAAARRLGG